MSSFINQLLFLRKPYVGITNVLSSLRQYMYILNSMPMILNSSVPVPKQVPIETSIVIEKPKQIESYITPKLQDSLFWCLFIAVYGYDEYLQIQRNYGVKELEIKKLVAEMVKEKPNSFKLTNHKVTKVAIQEILSELLTSQKETSMLCLISLTIYYNINIVLVNSSNEFMVEFIANKDVELPIFIIKKQEKVYSINVEPLTKDELINKKETMVCLENHLKPLKPISAYKVDDLIDLSTKLGIYNSAEKLKKPDLYEKLSEYMKWK